MSLSSFAAILVLVDAGVGGAEDVGQHHRRRLADQRVDLGRRGSHRHRLGAGGGRGGGGGGGRGDGRRFGRRRGGVGNGAGLDADGGVIHQEGRRRRSLRRGKVNRGGGVVGRRKRTKRRQSLQIGQ